MVSFVFVLELLFFGAVLDFDDGEEGEEEEADDDDDDDFLFPLRLLEDGLLSLCDNSSIVLIASIREEFDRDTRDA